MFTLLELNCAFFHLFCYIAVSKDLGAAQVSVFVCFAVLDLYHQQDFSLPDGRLVFDSAEVKDVVDQVQKLS